jgi:hypothetical protein
MSRMTGTGVASRSASAAMMENDYFEMNETIRSMESSDEAKEAKRLRARQDKLADAYFFKFIRPKLDRFPQIATA